MKILKFDILFLSGLPCSAWAFGRFTYWLPSLLL
jgi:hypothetical protein